MDRRHFSSCLAAGATLLGTAHAWAQAAAPVEGRHYVRVNPAAPVAAPAGKIDVVEFFWYGCPHCHALEPALEAWVRRLPPDVTFRRIPVAFSAVHESHQRLFYTLEAMGQLEAMHRRVFLAIHQQTQRLEREADQVAFLKAQGVDTARFAEFSRSFSVQTKMRQARQLADAYKIDGVPTIGVQGRFYTAGSLAGSNEAALAVADFLIKRVRSRT
ncbi:MAG: thiol:disulfide interchange protein DsbA [Pseudomonadota bacterium]|jgi:thiol:disulfide interchange protein DsbA